MQVLGRVDASLTADHPLATAFVKGSQTIYVAQNYGDTPLTVSTTTAASGSFNQAMPTGAAHPPSAYSMDPCVSTICKFTIAMTVMVATAPSVMG